MKCPNIFIFLLNLLVILEINKFLRMSECHSASILREYRFKKNYSGLIFTVPSHQLCQNSSTSTELITAISNHIFGDYTQVFSLLPISPIQLPTFLKPTLTVLN